MAKPKGTRTSNIHTVSTPALQSVHFGSHNFDPRFDARTKEQKRIDDTIAQYEQKSSPLAPKVSLVDYEGYPFITSMADRNAAGRTLTSIGDVPLYRPVEQQGGQDYMFYNPGQVWASGRAPVSGIMTAAQIMREATGKNPLYLPWRMSPTGGDFGAIAGEAMLSHAESSLGSGLKRQIDRDIKQFIPNWKGIDSPESYDQFRAAPDKMRKALMHMMDRDYRDQGTLNYGQARLSATDPNQFNAPQLQIQNVGQIFADKPVIPNSGHNYYPFGVPGEGLGVIERPHNIYELLPDVATERGVLDPKNPSHDDRRSMESNIRSGIINDKLLKSLGYATGGLINSAPEEAIKNTVTDPQAYKMLDMDLANLALMNQQMQPPRRMAGGGIMNDIYNNVIPAHARTYAESMFGNRSPINENNFSSSELDMMRDAIASSRRDRTITNQRLYQEQLAGAKNDKERMSLLRQGPSTKIDQTVGYQHYPNSGDQSTRDDNNFGYDSAVRNTLGRFAYEKDANGNLIATDTYKFRDDLPGQTRPSSDYAKMSTFEKISTLLKDSSKDKAGVGTLLSRAGSAFIGADGRPVNVNLGKAPFANGGAARHPSPEEMMIEMMERRYAAKA